MLRKCHSFSIRFYPTFVSKQTTLQEISGKTIWITGASSGIGEATAYQMAGEGVKLILTATNTQKLLAVQHRCTKLGADCAILPHDLSNTDNIHTLATQAMALFGSIDILFLNAGISQRAKALDTDDVVDQKIMQVNYFAPVKIAKAILPAMIAHGGGTIAVTTSISGKFGFPLRSSYAASKFALYGFFETVQAEYYDNNIRVVFICPGRVRTNISYNALEANGTKHAQLDDGQASGITAEKAATQIVSAIRHQKREVLIGGKELLMVYIKRFFPAWASRLVRKIRAT